MSCLINTGFTLGCNDVGGVEKLYVGTYDADTDWTISGTNSQITGVTGANTAYLFEQDIEFSGVEQNIVADRNNGTVYYESSVTMKMIGINADLLTSVRALAKAPLYCVAKLNSGEFVVLGVENAGRASEGTVGTGVAMGDMNGSSMTLMFKSKNGAYTMDSGVLGTDITIG